MGGSAWAGMEVYTVSGQSCEWGLGTRQAQVRLLTQPFIEPDVISELKQPYYQNNYDTHFDDRVKCELEQTKVKLQLLKESRNEEERYANYLMYVIAVC